MKKSEINIYNKLIEYFDNPNVSTSLTIARKYYYITFTDKLNNLILETMKIQKSLKSIDKLIKTKYDEYKKKQVK